MRTSRKYAIAVTVAALALIVSACSSDDGASTSTSTPSAELSAEAQAALDKAYTGFGGTLDLASVEPAEGIDFYVMSCGEAVETCSAPAAAMVEAAEAAGWSGNIVDGKLSPEGFATAIRQATAAGADVLVPVGISCSVAAAAFTEAKDAGVTIVGGGGIDDCEPKVWDAERLWIEEPPSPTGIFGAFGILQADYVVGKTDGDVKAVVINLTSNPWGHLITGAFSDELASLDGGEVLEQVDVADPEIADGSYVQKVVSALLAHADANALIVPTDAYLVNGLAAAIDQAGLADKLVVVGNFGSEAALDMIRAGQPGITATIGDAQAWESWGSVDTAVRVLAGQEPAYIGQSVQAIDADNNLPDSGPYNGSIDWKSKFLDSWAK
ncbi:MAG TPA: substrate-binding domain-containing protein [Microbacterium sp.]|nr:substrate-binding domain-containing protein [Microbacterium sp.]